MSLVKQDAEGNFLASLIYKKDALGSYLDKVSGEHFFYIPHKILWAKLRELHERKIPLDLITIKDACTKEELRDLGGASYLMSLAKNLPGDPNPDGYYTLIEEARVRRVYKTFAENLAKASEQEPDITRVQALSESLRLAPGWSEGASTIEQAVDLSVDSLSELRKGGFKLHWGVPGLDSVMGGIQSGKLIVVGGRTSHGKTTTAANAILHNLETNPDSRILYNGFENVEELPVRLASIKSGIKLDWFVKPHLLGDDQFSQVVEALYQMSPYKDRLTILNGEPIGKMRAFAKDLKPDLIILDYIQRCAHKHGEASGGEDGLRHGVARIASQMQDLAIESKAAVIVYSQFRRVQDERRHREPEITDLKESGDIENFADNIVLLWWPWRDVLDDSRWRPDQYKFLIRKNKTGPCMDVEARLNLETLRIA